MIIGIGIQARSHSSRFTGKIYEKIGEVSMLERIYQTCLMANPFPKAIEAFTLVLIPFKDEKLKEFCIEHHMDFLEGSEEDLIQRYLEVFQFKKSTEALIRITSDCPLISKTMIESCMKGLMTCDYSSNTMIRSFPDGYDIQGGSKRAWEYIDKMQLIEREHPWKGLDENQTMRDVFNREGFSINHLVNESNPIFQKLSVDTPEDLKRVRKYASQ